MKKLPFFIFGLSVFSVVVRTAIGAVAETDRYGRVQAMMFDAESITIKTDIRIPNKDWSRSSGLWNAKDVAVSRSGRRCASQGRIEVEKEKFCRFGQIVEEEDQAVRISIQIMAEADLDTAGVYFWLDVPIEQFSGGQCKYKDAQGVARTVELPEKLAEDIHFLSCKTQQLTFQDTQRNLTLRASWDRPLPTTVQDSRQWKGDAYTAYPALHRGLLKKGEEVSLEVTLQLEGRADTRAARLEVHPAKVRYRLDGFGGNYCFGIESPVTHYTLDNLRVAWARTEMTLREWEPKNDNESAEDTNWDYLEKQDRAGSNLRREFLLAREIQKRGIPYCISIWHLPTWLYADPNRDRSEHKRRVADEQWPELLECIGSYLVYANKQYGVEPDLFSFNEANIGVYVYFSAEEHREAIKRIGAHLKKLGLRTKMLLADATGPGGTHIYAEPAAKDTEAMQYVGAVGFHSWGGANPQQYGAWGDLAERLHLPLLVAELGVDAAAWRTKSYYTYHYALQEVKMYQELLMYARPQGTMQWEFTSDYRIVKEETSASRKTKLIPTKRFWFVKHFCNLTPADAEVLATESDHGKVLCTAFTGPGIGGKEFTCHIANLGVARDATLRGIPPGLRNLSAIRTSETEAFGRLPAVVVHEGEIRLPLAGQSLLTLTTMTP